MGRTTIIFLLVLFAVPGLAQKEDNRYNERSMEIQKDIWQDTSAAFQVKQIPAELNNESAVIIADYNEIVNAATSSYKFSVGRSLQKIDYQVTLRQRIKINDKTALEKYSSIEYIKKKDLSFSYGFSRIQNKMVTYIGAKVIKPDGLETIINSSEEVLTKNENKNKEAKLAIPGLQVGDILDYYIKRDMTVEGETSRLGPFTFFINGEYPILYYSIRLQLDKESGVEYINANGAPPLKESTNDNGDIILELTQTNLPKSNSSLLTSPFRQYPYISLQCLSVMKGYDSRAGFTRGQVKQGHHTGDIVNQLIKRINGVLNIRKYPPLSITQNYFGGTEKMKDVPKDSVIKVLYNAWRYYRMSEWLKDAERIPVEIKDRYALSLDMAVYFSKILATLDIDNTIYLVRSRNLGSLENVMNAADFDALIKFKTGNDKSYWLAFDDIFTQFNEIPVRFQGEEAITIRPEKTEKVINYTAGLGKVPVTIPAYNSIFENLVVSFDSSDIGVLQINRTCSQTGGLRHEHQKELLLTENIKENIAGTVEQNNKLEEKLSDDRKSQLAAAFANERNNLKTSFEDDVSDHFNAKPKNLTAYEIIQPGLYTYSVPFEYKSSFNLENYVKKAGSSYLLEVGKLIGERQEITEKDRGRNIDVFLFCPMTFTWAINISVPAGYDVKGIEELNKTIDNETGSFSCAATNDGHFVNIRIRTVYAHNFEKAANWPKLLDIMDAVNNIFTQKILLEKSKS